MSELGAEINDDKSKPLNETRTRTLNPLHMSGNDNEGRDLNREKNPFSTSSFRNSPARLASPLSPQLYPFPCCLNVEMALVHDPSADVADVVAVV
jgi:hypothetical protein